jgi:hypothetical protein
MAARLQSLLLVYRFKDTFEGILKR